MQAASDKVTCINPACRKLLDRPTDRLTKCKHCKTEFFVFCHEFPYRLFERRDCGKCPNSLFYFFCFKCNDVRCYKQFRMGSITTCKKCGFEGCYVKCNSCQKTDCFKPTRRYEGVPWRCEFCQRNYNFMTCDRCHQQHYRPSFHRGDAITCDNERCKASLTVKKCQGCKFIFLDSRQRSKCDACFNELSISEIEQVVAPRSENNSSNPLSHIFEQGSQRVPSMIPFPNFPPALSLVGGPAHSQPQIVESGSKMLAPNKKQTSVLVDLLKPTEQADKKGSVQPAAGLAQYCTPMLLPDSCQNGQTPQNNPSLIQFQDLCKICLGNRAQYVNSTCYHITSCRVCVKRLHSTCPVCRAVGEFKRVYR